MDLFHHEDYYPEVKQVLIVLGGNRIDWEILEVVLEEMRVICE